MDERDAPISSDDEQLAEQRQTLREHRDAMVKSLVAIAWADGRVAGEESEVLEGVIAAFELEPAHAQHVREYARSPRTLDDISLADLSAHDRRLLVQHATIVTYVDGSQSEEERKVLRDLVARLRLPELEAEALLIAADARAKSLLSLLED